MEGGRLQPLRVFFFLARPEVLSDTSNQDKLRSLLIIFSAAREWMGQLVTWFKAQGLRVSHGLQNFPFPRCLRIRISRKTRTAP